MVSPKGVSVLLVKPMVFICYLQNSQLISGVAPHVRGAPAPCRLFHRDTVTPITLKFSWERRRLARTNRSAPPHVRVGSIASLWLCADHFRSTLNFGHASTIARRTKEKPPEGGSFNSNLLISDQAAINASFDFRRYPMKPTPAKPSIIIAQVGGSGIAVVNSRATPTESLALKVRFAKLMKTS
jgi:hypothetical protein